MQVNGWTERVEISKDEISGMHGYVLTFSRLSKVLSTDETLISASAAPHCGDNKTRIKGVGLLDWFISEDMKLNVPTTWK